MPVDIFDELEIRILPDPLPDSTACEPSAEIAAEYERVARQVIAICAGIDPCDATRDCNVRYAGRLPRYSERDRMLLAELIRSDEEAVMHLVDRVQETGASLDQRIGIAHLIHRVRACMFKVFSPYHLNSPLKYVEIILENIVHLLRDGFGTEEETKDFLRTNLREIQRFLREAKTLINDQIESGQKIYRASYGEALENLHHLVVLLNTAFKRKLDVPGGEAEIALEATLSAIKQFRQFLRQIPEAALSDTHGYAVDRETLKGIYMYERGLGDINPEDVIKIGRIAVSKEKQKVLRLKRTLAEKYGIDPMLLMPQFMEALKPHMRLPRDKEEFIANTRLAFETANEFFRERAVVPVEECHVKVDNAPAFLQKYGFMICFANLFDAQAEKPEAMYLVGADSLNPAQNLQCSLENMLVIGTHEITPGHINQGRILKRHPDLARRIGGVFCASAMIEGWGLLAEEIAADSGFFEYAAQKLGLDADIIQFRYYVLKLLRAGRMVVDPSLQLGQMTQEQVETYLIDECLQEERFAKGQASYYPMLPGYPSSYYMAYLELKKIRDKVVDMFAHIMTVEEARYWFYKTFLAECGFMPAHLVRRYILEKARVRISPLQAQRV